MLGRPVDAERARGAVQALRRRAGRRGGSVRRRPTRRVDHQGGGGHAGQQRDLRVPLLDRQLRRGTPGATGRRSTSTSCSGSGSETPPRAASRAQPQLADLLEQHQRLVRACRRRSAAARRRSRAWPRDRTSARSTSTSVPSPVSSTLDRPQQRRAAPGRAAATPAPSESDGRVQRDLGVGAVERLAAPVRLDVDRVARRDERRDVGDRVVHDVAVAVALEVQRLVEVHRRRRVDRDERDVGAVELGQPRVGGRRLRPRPPRPRPGTRA